MKGWFVTIKLGFVFLLCFFADSTMVDGKVIHSFSWREPVFNLHYPLRATVLAGLDQDPNNKWTPLNLPKTSSKFVLEDLVAKGDFLWLPSGKQKRCIDVFSEAFAVLFIEGNNLFYRYPYTFPILFFPFWSGNSFLAGGGGVLWYENTTSTWIIRGWSLKI